MTPLKKRRASVLLISVLVVCAFSLLMVVSLSELQISRSFVGLNRREASVSLYAAEACLEESLYRLELDPDFTGTELILDGQSTCTSTVSGSQITVLVEDGVYRAEYRADFSTNTVNLVTNFHLVGWQEI